MNTLLWDEVGMLEKWHEEILLCNDTWAEYLHCYIPYMQKNGFSSTTGGLHLLQTGLPASRALLSLQGMEQNVMQ